MVRKPHFILWQWTVRRVDTRLVKAYISPALGSRLHPDTVNMWLFDLTTPIGLRGRSYAAPNELGYCRPS